MRRLPVIATIREAYDFTFANLGAIIGLIWLPMVIVTVAEFFVTQHYGTRVQEAMAAGNPNAAGPAALVLFFYMLSALALYAMMFTSVTQLALGQRQGGAMIHFTFGAVEWRMFRTLFGVVLFLLLPYILFTLSTGSLTSGGATAQQGMAAVTSLLLLAGVLYFAVRLTAVLLPVVVTEEKGAVVRAWTLTVGNFWRLFGVMVAAVAPLSLMMMLALAFLLRDSITPGVTPSPEAVAAIRNANLPLTTGLSFLVAPLMIGLTVGASVFSFKALTRTDISV